MLEETPWVRQAQKESEARRNVGILFDDNRLNDETARTAAEAGRAAARPTAPGLVPRRAGQRLHHALHHHRLRPAAAPGRGHRRRARPSSRSTRLDAWIDERYRDILKHGKPGREPPDAHHRPVPVRPQLLPGGPSRSPPQHKEAVDYFLGQARKYWLKLASRQSQAHLAIALKRFGDQHTPRRHHALAQGTQRVATRSWACSGATRSCPGGGTAPRSRRRP